ncbi:hypothetical protein QCD58_004694 [Enterobacter hormaechei]|nr:hypothetical protein [Enterobacter hormaechei]
MSGDLEGRVERLEANLSSAKESLATLVERTSHLATKADLKDEVGAIGARITWSIFVPLLLVVLGGLGKEFFK